MLHRFRAAVAAFRNPRGVARVLAIRVQLDTAAADRQLESLQDSIAGAIRFANVLTEKVERLQFTRDHPRE